MLVFGDGSIKFGKNELNEIALIKKLYEMGAEKITFAKEVEETNATIFSVWTRQYGKQCHMATIQGSTAQFLYDFLWVEIEGGVLSFDFETVWKMLQSRRYDAVEGKSAIDILKEEKQKGATVISIDNRLEGVVKLFYPNGVGYELEVADATVVYEQLKNFVSSKWWTSDLNKLLEALSDE